MNDIRNRALGALIGLAVGDAVGTTNEFQEPYEFKPLTDMVGGGFFNLAPGQWTDDTSMALCLADTILSTDTVDEDDLLTRFLRWYRYGYNSSTGNCFDIGGTCIRAVRRFENDYCVYTEQPDNSVGNGSIMRLAPIAVRWWDDIDKAAEMALRQGKTTHNSDECNDCCTELADILVSYIQGAEVDLSSYNDDRSEDSISNIGCAIETLDAAAWCVETTSSFKEAVLKAANLGGDADTIAAVAGQIAGAKYGLDAIPQHWKDRLYEFDYILSIANSLFDRSID